MAKYRPPTLRKSQTCEGSPDLRSPSCEEGLKERVWIKEVEAGRGGADAKLVSVFISLEDFAREMKI